MKTWVVISDSASARLFESPGNIEILKKIKNFEHPESRKKVSEIVTDQAGSVKTSQGVHGGAPSHSDLKEVEALKFAQEISKFLSDAVLQESYQRLIITAPPQFLGLIKENLSANATKQIFKTIDKDYTKFKDHELPEALGKHL